jgi:Carboxypeptidase regulatory-like domain/TonB dependent receptor
MFLSLPTLALVLNPLLVSAQGDTATLNGRVTDPDGIALAQVKIQAINVSTNAVYATETNGFGLYDIVALPPGQYRITVEKEGFEQVIRLRIELHVADILALNFTLQVGSVAQSVTIVGEVPLVNTTTSSLGGLMSEQDIEQLPLNGRNWTDLTLLQPGVANVSSLEADVRGIGGDIFLSNGAPQRSNNFMLDGAIMQNFYGMNPASVAQTALGVDGIKEFKTITDMFSADYGLTMGSQTTIVSKGGTNQFHWDAFEFLRNSALEARNHFDGATVPEFRQNQFGGALGGPIRKDKTFFFGVYEGFQNNLGLTQIAGVPAGGCHGGANQIITSNFTGPCPQIASSTNPAQLFSVTISPVVAPLLALLPDPNVPGSTSQYKFGGSQITDENYGQMRVDQNISNTDALFVRYTIDDTNSTLPDTYPTIENVLFSRSHYLTLSETHSFSSTVINNLRSSFSRTGFVTDSLSPANFHLVTGQPMGDFSIGGVTTGSLGYGPESTTGYAKQNILTWSDDIFWTTGRHALKFGALINRFGQGIQDNFLLAGNIAFQSLSTFFAGTTSSIKLTPPSANGNRYYLFTTFGFFVQDDFRIRPRLTLNLGLRYEFNTAPEEDRGRQYAFRGDFATDVATTQGPVMQNPSLRNFSPRIGFAWDVFGNGKTSLRGGGGFYYDIATIGSALQQDVLGTPPLSYQAGTSTPTQLQLPLDRFFTVPENFEGAQLQSVDYYAKQPYLIQYNLSLERQLPSNTALSMAYVGSRGIHLWASDYANDFVPTSIINGNESWDPFSPNYHRVNPFWGALLLLNTQAFSSYNSLQVELTRRATHGLQFQSSYTYARFLDTPQGQTVSHDPEIASTSDPFHVRTDYGPAETDLTHQFKFNALFHLPNISSQKFLSKLLNGWWTGSIVTIQSGFAFSPTVSGNPSLDGDGEDRPDVVTAANVVAVRNGTYKRDGILGGQNPNAIPFDRNEVTLGGINSAGKPGTGWFDPNMFIAAPPGLLGDAGRGMLRGPGLSDWDCSLNKDTKVRFLGEAGNVQFRAEFFNLLNHTNFRQPNAATYVSGPVFISEGVVSGATSVSPTAGQISSTATPAREIQFGLRIEF